MTSQSLAKSAISSRSTSSSLRSLSLSLPAAAGPLRCACAGRSWVVSAAAPTAVCGIAVASEPGRARHSPWIGVLTTLPTGPPSQPPGAVIATTGGAADPAQPDIGDAVAASRIPWGAVPQGGGTDNPPSG